MPRYLVRSVTSHFSMLMVAMENRLWPCPMPGVNHVLQRSWSEAASSPNIHQTFGLLLRSAVPECRLSLHSVITPGSFPYHLANICSSTLDVYSPLLRQVRPVEVRIPAPSLPSIRKAERDFCSTPRLRRTYRDTIPALLRLNQVSQCEGTNDPLA